MVQPISLEYRPTVFQQVFHEGQNRMVLLSMPQDYVLAHHRAPQMLAVLVLTGSIQFTIDNEPRILNAMEGLAVPANTEHAVLARTQSTVLLTLFESSEPVPSTHDAEGGDEENHVCVHTRPDMMARISPELKLLVDDHVQVCDALEVVHEPFNAEAYEKMLNLVGEELDHHFVFEETILFPRLAKYLGGSDVGPIAKLLQEHTTLREKHANCANLLKKWRDDGSVQGTLERRTHAMAHLLLKHIENEDGYIFPMASRILSKDELAVIDNELAAHANPHA